MMLIGFCWMRWKQFLKLDTSSVNRVVVMQLPYETQDNYIFGLWPIEVPRDEVNDTFFHTVSISSEMKLLLHAYLKITFFVKKEIWQMTEESKPDRTFICFKGSFYSHQSTSRCLFNLILLLENHVHFYGGVRCGLLNVSCNSFLHHQTPPTDEICLP